ncbi:MAG: ATP-binding protein [Thermodesulfobacteriota bacterium]|nr:ATP-binding protein [Thermodesulfobacteriota bacterium]
MKHDKEQRESYYRQLSRNMVATVILVSMTPMILVIVILLFQFKASYYEKTYAHLEELVQKHRQRIDGYLEERLANIQLLSASFDHEVLMDKSFLDSLLQRLKTAYGDVFVDLGVIDRTGHQQAYAGPYQLDNAMYDEANWFKSAINHPYYISDVFMGLRGSPHFIVAVRRFHNGKPWILRTTIDFKAFNNLVENLRIGETGFAFIVNKHGEFQTRPSSEIKIGTALDRILSHETNRFPEGVRVLAQKDPSGIPSIYVAAALKNGEWYLIFKQKQWDAFSDLTRTVHSAIAIFVVGSLAIIAMATVLSRRMVRRIRQADRQNETLNQQMIETGKLASVGELAAGIAHEINNPVAIMVEEAGWVGDLMEEITLAQNNDIDEIRRALKQISVQGQRCREITHKLLSFARKTDTTLKDVQINDLIREIIELSGQMAKYNKVTITTDLMAELPYVTISPSEMQQVMLNLINNAMDVMEKTGGNLHIATKMSKLEKDHIVITVEDDGPGIPEANLPLIFNPFFTTKPVGKGTGLGLSICYGIIEKMGGKIDVQSTVGKGTRFRIWVPYQKAEINEQADTKNKNL